MLIIQALLVAMKHFRKIQYGAYKHFAPCKLRELGIKFHLNIKGRALRWTRLFLMPTIVLARRLVLCEICVTACLGRARLPDGSNLLRAVIFLRKLYLAPKNDASSKQSSAQKWLAFSRNFTTSKRFFFAIFSKTNYCFLSSVFKLQPGHLSKRRNYPLICHKKKIFLRYFIHLIQWRTVAFQPDLIYKGPST